MWWGKSLDILHFLSISALRGWEYNLSDRIFYFFCPDPILWICRWIVGVNQNVIKHPSNIECLNNFYRISCSYSSKASRPWIKSWRSKQMQKLFQFSSIHFRINRFSKMTKTHKQIQQLPKMSVFSQKYIILVIKGFC